MSLSDPVWNWMEKRIRRKEYRERMPYNVFLVARILTHPIFWTYSQFRALTTMNVPDLELIKTQNGPEFILPKRGFQNFFSCFGHCSWFINDHIQNRVAKPTWMSFILVHVSSHRLLGAASISSHTHYSRISIYWSYSGVHFTYSSMRNGEQQMKLNQPRQNSWSDSMNFELLKPRPQPVIQSGEKPQAISIQSTHATAVALVIAVFYGKFSRITIAIYSRQYTKLCNERIRCLGACNAILSSCVDGCIKNSLVIFYPPGTCYTWSSHTSTEFSREICSLFLYEAY